LPSPYGAIPLLLVALEVVVEVIHLPFDAVGIFHPELVLVGVAAVDPHLLQHGQSGDLDASQLRHHVVDGIDLDADVVDRARADRAARRKREVDWRPLGQELDILRLDLDRVPAQELLVESSAFGEIRHVHVEMDLGAHGSP
jgi:hypothetical protein